MKTNKRAKRRFAITLAAVMALQCMVFSTSAFAAEDPAYDLPETPAATEEYNESEAAVAETEAAPAKTVEETAAPAETEAAPAETVEETEVAPAEAVEETEVAPAEAVEQEAVQEVTEEQPIAAVQEESKESAVPPMEANQKMLTGVRLGDGKAGNGDGKYYCLAYTDTFKAIDSRYIPFETKLSASQYEAADYDFTDLTLTYKGETYAYRPNGPQAGDGKDFHYYTISFMKVDKLAKSTYAGGYLVEGGHPSAWKLVTDLKKDANTGLWKDGYYHRDYQATLHIGDAPDADEVIEEPAIEEPAIEEPAVEEPAIEEAAVEEPAIEEPAVEEPAIEEPVIEEPAVEEPAIEEIAAEIEEIAAEDTAVEEIAAEIEEIAAEDTAIEEQTEEIEAPAAAPADDKEDAPVIPASTNSNDNTPAAPTENGSQDAPAAASTAAISNDEAPAAASSIEISQDAAPAAAASIDDDAAPQAEGTGYWTLTNLLLTISLALMSSLMILFFIKRRHDDDEEAEQQAMAN